MSDTPEGLKKALLDLLRSVGLHPFSRVLRGEDGDIPPPVRPALEWLGLDPAKGDDVPPEGPAR